ncbi:MAG: hypothetical protein CMJ86_06575 [Planctomycetes bacterium]|nr:hypothetical protein [Planctomycetota bacterium]
MLSTKMILVRQVLCQGDSFLKGAGILVRGARILEVAPSLSAARRLARRWDAALEDKGPGLWSAGLVNAHAHLELTALEGVVPRLPFAPWVAALMQARAGIKRADLQRGLRRGADRLLATGTTALGDNDSLGLATGVLAAHPMRTRIWREALDAWDPKRTSAALRFARAPRRGTQTLAFGLAPHAPYTVSPALGRALARQASRRRVPISIHFAESLAEDQWMRRGSGPLARILPASPGLSSLDHLERTGLLARRTALVHCNRVSAAGIETIARAGAAVVHCPQSHRFFRRSSFDACSWLDAGVVLALGTDSRASNWDLDMRAEMARMRVACSDLDPSEIWTMATEGGAHCLGWSQRLGRVAKGFLADLVQWDLTPRSKSGALEALTGSLPAVRRVLVAGREVCPGD